MTAAQITRCSLVIARRVSYEQDKLNSARGKLPADTPGHKRKEWLWKEARVVLAYDESNRPGPPRYRRAVPGTHMAEARAITSLAYAGLRPYPGGTGAYPATRLR